MSSLERLAGATGIAPNAVAPAVPLRSRRYGEDRLHLLVRDPHRVLAIWEISPALAARARARASEAGAPLRFRIQVERKPTDGGEPSVAAAADLADAMGQESWYLDLPESGGEARAVLGLDLRGGFERLLASRWTPVPPDRPCAEEGTWDPVPAEIMTTDPRTPAGYLSILLHAHLPFVRHPEYTDALEERWLVEALIECYLPLLRMLEARAQRGARGTVTVSLSPTLMAMLDDPLLRDRFVAALGRLEELAEREVERTRGDHRFRPLADHYRDRLDTTRRQYADRYGRDVTAAFRALERTGVVRLITCGATHGFLPLMDLGASSWRAQIGAATREFERRIGHPPEGMWLPECGYTPGVESVLAEFGIRYFVVDSHAIADACPRPRPGTAAPFRTGSGVYALGRDAESSRQVWSATEGYPGDAAYREYYRDQGFDLPLDQIREFLPSGGTRTHLGFKYHRITDRRFSHREPYDPAAAQERVRAHARHFVEGRTEHACAAAAALGQPALLLAPYDAELFGHWWYEGPEWLDGVLDEVARGSELQAVNPMDAVRSIPRSSEGRLHPSSWGAGGYAAVWLDPTNDCVYRHLLRAAEIMRDLASRGDRGRALEARALRQAGRELLLAQASDWAFIMKTGTLTPYAVLRTETHLARFERLAQALSHDEVDERELAEMESLTPLFPTLETEIFA